MRQHGRRGNILIVAAGAFLVTRLVATVLVLILEALSTPGGLTIIKPLERDVD